METMTNMATDAQIHRAAIAWCGAKERETFQSDIEYFLNNWRSLPGLGKYVEDIVAADVAAPR